MRTRYIAITALWIAAALVAVWFGIAKPHSEAPIFCLGVAVVGTSAMRDAQGAAERRSQGHADGGNLVLGLNGGDADLLHFG